jgi:hypothetical protein
MERATQPLDLSNGRDDARRLWLMTSSKEVSSGGRKEVFDLMHLLLSANEPVQWER